MRSTAPIMIRPAELADAPAIAEIYNDAVLNTTATFDTEPKTVDERTAWLQSHDSRHPVLVAVIEERVVGWASLTKWSDRPGYSDTAETSFYVHSGLRGCGIGRKLRQAIIEEARRFRFHTLIAVIADGSEWSIRLHESAGFVRIGTLKEVGRKFGKLIDVHVMQKIMAYGASG